MSVGRELGGLMSPSVACSSWNGLLGPPDPPCSPRKETENVAVHLLTAALEHRPSDIFTGRNFATFTVVYGVSGGHSYVSSFVRAR